MKNENKTKKQLINELATLRQRITELDRSEKEHKRAAKALKILENKLNGILVSMVDLVFAFDKEGKFIFFHSPRLEDLYVPPERFIGKRHSEVMPHHINELFADAFKRNKIGERAEYEYWLEIKGKVRWFFAKLSPLFIDRKFSGSVAVVREITKRKQIEEELKKHPEHLEELVEERTTKLEAANEQLQQEIIEHKQTKEALQESEILYRTLFEGVPVGIGLATFDARILSCNVTMLKMTGYSEEELKQINLRNTYQNPEERTILIERLKKERFVSNFEAELKRKDGTTYWASLTITPFPLRDKNVLLTVAEDITRRKRAELKLAESASKLREQKSALEQKNIALREIINQIELGKRKIRDDIEANVKLVINPILDKLKIGKYSPKIVSLLQYHLERLTSSFGIKITEKGFNLTPREVEICNMVKGGLTSKEISNLLNISYRTVDRHRRNIRHKLEITNKRINLASFLREL